MSSICAICITKSQFLAKKRKIFLWLDSHPALAEAEKKMSNAECGMQNAEVILVFREFFPIFTGEQENRWRRSTGWHRHRDCGTVQEPLQNSAFCTLHSAFAFWLSVKIADRFGCGRRPRCDARHGNPKLFQEFTD